jgi:hypothetical protein
MTTVDVRCPVNRSRLFMRLHLRDPDIGIDRSTNLIEVACRDCRQLHRYDPTGDLVESAPYDPNRQSPFRR